jgi:hypothetical protein
METRIVVATAPNDDDESKKVDLRRRQTREQMHV